MKAEGYRQVPFSKAPALVRRSDEQCAPLTPGQRALLAHASKNGSGLTLRGCCIGIQIAGDLDFELLRGVMNALALRHEALRTRIIRNDGVLMQHISSLPTHEFDQADITDDTSADATAAARCADQFMRQKIDPAVDPLFAARLFRRSERESMLLVAMDHLVTDGTSNQIWIRDFKALLDQHAGGLSDRLPSLPVQFGDYALWLQQSAEVWRVEHEKYWRERLEGARAVQVPRSNALEASQHPEGSRIEVAFGASLTHRLQDLALRCRTILPLVVLSVCAVELACWCRQSDMVLGFATSGRLRPELRNVIGFIASVLYMRVCVREDDTFAEVLESVKREFAGAYLHQDFGRVPELFPECAPEILVNWLPPAWAPAEGDETDGTLSLKVVPLDAPWVPTAQKMVLFFSQTISGISLVVRFRRDSLTETSVRGLVERLLCVADICSGNPLRKLVHWQAERGGTFS